jgi:hypothetical protein
MARITVYAVDADGEPLRWTLSERIVAEHLASEHHTAQLLERLSWATADAAAFESHSGNLNTDLREAARPVPLRARTRGDRASRASGRRALASVSRAAT